MKATVKHLKNEFQPYTIENIVSVQYVINVLVITYIDGYEVQTAKYADMNVAVEIN